jgi:UPF0271 protein
VEIDLNADLGEGFGSWRMGDDKAMMEFVSSASIACGGHAGDNATMYTTVSAARTAGVTIGAHPGFEDRQGFGRRRLPLSLSEITQLVASQLGALIGVAALAGTDVAYVKPHGALGNWAAEDIKVATAIVDATRAVMGSSAKILAISATALQTASEERGVAVYSEIFADRGYTPAGHLIARGQEGAMIHDAKEASTRLLRFLNTGLMPTVGGEAIKLKADSICIHGDSPNAYQMAKLIQFELEHAGISICPFTTSQKIEHNEV